MAAKQAILRGIRRFHVALFRRELPRRPGVYLHALEPGQHAAFEEMVAALRTSGYALVDPPAVAEPGPERRAFLSFDDNFRSWHAALPLFQRLDVKATFYVNACAFRDRAGPAELERYFDRVAHEGERVPLSTGELRELAAAGHTIGSHTFSHALLPALPFPAACEEIRRGKEALEDVLGAPVLDFSYPFGMRRHFNERLRAYCAELGLRTVASARPTPHAAQHPLRLHRLVWQLDRPVAYNLDNFRVDGRLFEWLTGRGPTGRDVAEAGG